MKIGIGVTTFRRPHMMAKCSLEISKFRPSGSRLIIHDDSGAEDGVAKSKNACIASLMRMGCEHLFLFDDDTWPDAKDWWVPYVESSMDHLSYTWAPSWDPDRKPEPIGNGIQAWPSANGCMLYFSRKAIEVAGGMRTLYGKWGYEHLDLSYRLFKMGLTPEPFMSLVDQKGIYASDEHHDDISSISVERRAEAKRHGEALYLYWRKRKEFVPYVSA